MDFIQEIRFANDPPTNRIRWPRLVLNDNWREKIELVPIEAQWKEDGEPQFALPGIDWGITYNNALEYEIARPATPIESELFDYIDMLIARVKKSESRWDKLVNEVKSISDNDCSIAMTMDLFSRIEEGEF